MARGETPPGVWNGLLRGYGPLLLLVVVVALMAVLVPSKPPESATAVSGGGVGLQPNGAPGAQSAGTPGGSSTPGGAPSAAQIGVPVSGGSTGPSGILPAIHGSTGTATGPGTTVPPVTGPCANRTVQVLGDSYSPPCIAFSGNNGGATARGVTPTEVKIAVRYTPADKGFQQSVAQVAGAHLIDTQADVDRTIAGLATYFNNNFQFYGRKIVPVFYNGVGSLANETLGEGQAETEADATTVAQQIKAFGDITAGSEPYADDLARQGVMAFGDPYMSAEWHEQHAPYAWSIAPDLSKLVNVSATWYNQRLAGHVAQYAGPGLNTKPRKVAVVSAENSWYQDSIAPMEAILKQSGTNAENIKYQLDINTLSNQAANIIPKLQADGITTIMCACDPILPLFLSATASRANYFPEFVITGTALTDVDLVGQLWSQDFTAHAFGLSGLQQLGPPTESLGYEAYKQVRSDEPAAAVQIIYYQMYQLAIGLEMAGPDLTPQTFAQGMFRYPAHNGEDGLWQYSPTNYTATNDVREIYWESTAISPYNNLEGGYLDMNPGKRYNITDLPHGEPVIPNFPGPINPNANIVTRVRRTSAALRASWDGLSSRGRAVSVLVAIAAVLAVGYSLPLTKHILERRAPIGILVLGLVYGAVTAFSAIGLILIYRANRFINFAYAALGGAVGLVAIGLFIKHGWSYWLVLPLGVGVGALVGGITEVVVIRRFRNSSRLVLTVASIGLAQLLGGLGLIVDKGIGFQSLLGGFHTPVHINFRIGVVAFGGDEMLIIFIMPVLIIALSWFLLRTDAGMAVRAAAENHDRALLYGIPIRRLSTLVWLIAGGLATLGFILKAPFAGVSPGVATFGATDLLPPLAAAVIAQMESLPIAVGAGLGLGVMEQVVRWNSTGSPTFVYVVYLTVILVALLVQRGRRSRAEENADSSWSAIGLVKPIPRELRGLPEVRIAKWVLVVAVAAAAIFLPLTWSPSNQLLAGFAMVWGMVGVSLVILTGWGGNISLGQFAIVGVGAVVAGNLIANNRTDFLLVVIASGLAGAVISLLVGLPALRIRGQFLTVTTLALAVAFDSYFLNVDNFRTLIPTSVPSPVLFKRFDLAANYDTYAVCLVFLALAILAARGVRKTRGGRAVVAARDNGRAAAAVGVNTTSATLSAFILAGVIAGVAGALDVVLLHALNPGTFPPDDSVAVFSTAVIGGLGSLGGALSGVFFFRFLDTLTWLGNVRVVLTGALLLVVLYVVPGGFGQILFNLRDRVLRRIAKRRDILVPSLVADRAVTSVAAVDGNVGLRLPSHGAHLLSCRGVDLSYGPVQVLFGVDFDVAEGEIVALLGTNGAGKSTLLKGVCGLVPPSGGRVTFDGSPTGGATADATARRGLALMPGGKGVFPTLTVDENLRLAAWQIRHDHRRVAEARDEVFGLFPALSDRRHQMAGNLSGGEQQMLALGGALMTHPKLLMIDELSLGLAPAIVDQLLEVVREIHRRGTTIVLVEQSVNVALHLAERAVFMEKGEVRFEGPTAQLLERPDILRSVFVAGAVARHSSTNGQAVVRASEAERAIGDKVVLDIEGVVKTFGGIVAVNGADLEVHDGEIVGLIGHNGAGKTTLMDGISGYAPFDRGTVTLLGVDVSEWPPHDRALGGLGRSFQDARLFPTLSVVETIAVARERHVACRDMLAEALGLPASYSSEMVVWDKVEELIDLMGLGAFHDKLVGELSTGSRRIVDLACVLAHEPRVLMLDEPSSGVAQKETEALAPLLIQVRDRTGCSILIIEHDMPLVRSISDRMVALELGGVIASGTPDEVLSHPQVVASYLGTNDAVIDRSGKRRRSKSLAAAR